MNIENCDQIYLDVVRLTGNSNDSLFRLSQCFLSGYNIQNLRAMLRSNDVGIVIDGLFICKEIGKLVCQVQECIESLRSSQDPDIKRMASTIANVCELYR